MEKYQIKKAGIGIKAGAIADLTGFCYMNDEDIEILYQHPYAPRREDGGRACVGILFPKAGYGPLLLPFELIYDTQEVFLASFGKNDVIDLKAAMSIWNNNH